MSYDLSSYRCQVCGQYITFKDFADGVAGRSKEDMFKAEHFKCRKRLDNPL